MGAVISCEDQRSLEPEAESVQTERSNYGCLPMQSIRESSGLHPQRLNRRASKDPTCYMPYPLRGKGPDEGTGEVTLKGKEPTWAQHN